MLIAVALASGVALIVPTLGKGSGLSPQDMVQLMNREKAVVIMICLQVLENYCPSWMRYQPGPAHNR